jgi:hypothetical protein
MMFLAQTLHSMLIRTPAVFKIEPALGINLYNDVIKSKNYLWVSGTEGLQLGSCTLECSCTGNSRRDILGRVCR